MAVTYRKRSRAFTLLFIILLIALALNIQEIGRYFYPFPHRGMIQKYAAKNHVDPLLLVAIIKGESNFDPRARSRKGARGLMQIMPETGKWIAQKVGLESFHPDKLYDVETNIYLGTWYIAELLRQFDGQLVPALAAYNGGQGNVRNWLAEVNWDHNSDLDISQIPFPETRKYVKKVLKNYWIYQFLYRK